MSYEDRPPPILCSLYEQKLIKPVTRSPVPCRLKSNGTLCLEGIISVFTESITEEHAWAVIYGCAKALEEMLSSTTPEKQSLFLVSSPGHILIHVDGKVHPSTFLASYDHNQGSERSPMTSVDETIAKLGEVIYNTLDYGLTDDDERQLTPGLENLLELMLSSDSEDVEIEEDHRTVETDDEGIEQDHDEGGHHHSHALSSSNPVSNHKLSHNLSSVYRVLNLCTNHLSVSKEAEHHFKNVCRALVSEALELSFFIERVQNRDLNQAKEIQELALLDWACLWKETMFQLRQGVKLKKTNYTKTPIEYELTPYEILMDDIRSRRYKLNKVMVNGDLPPKVKKDAHDIILEFIRSRPPLKPASRRVLPPKKLDITPQELLMKSICSPSAKASLKKTSGPPSPKKSFIGLYSGGNIPSIVMTHDEPDDSYPIREKKSASPKKLQHSSSLLSLSRKQKSSLLYEKSKSSGNLKRLIKPDPQFLKFDPCGGDDDFFSSPLSPELRRSPTPASSQNSSPSKSGVSRRSEVSLNTFESNLSPILSENRRVSYSSPADAIDVANLRRRQETLTSTPNVYGTYNSAFISPQGSPNLSVNCSQRDDWSVFNKCDLSLEEMIHIRSVHTKAELEDSTIDPQIKSDLENSKLCFICMKQYFGFFSWTYKCKLCRKCICSSCMTKIKIPSDDFSKISVRSLLDSFHQETPRNASLKQLPTQSICAFNSSPSRIRNSSSPSCPKNNKINIEPSSLPLTPTSTHDKKVKLRRSNTLKYERESKKSDGTLSTVCLKCKEIIQQIPNRNQRRQHVTRSLCLG